MSGWRLLVDESSEDAAEPLRTRGFDVETVPEAVGKGAQDTDVAELARETGRVLLTADRDFLEPELNYGLTVLMVPTGELPAPEIARRVQQVATWVDSPAQLDRTLYLEQ